MFVQFLRMMKIIPRYEDVRLFVRAVWLSPQALGDSDPFIPRHNARDHHSDRTEEAPGFRNWGIEINYKEASPSLWEGRAFAEFIRHFAIVILVRLRLRC